MAEEGSAPELGGSSEAKGSFFSIAPITQIEKELSAADTPITIRMQRLFELREHRSPEATSLLLAALKDRTLIDSILFRQAALSGAFTAQTLKPVFCERFRFRQSLSVRLARPVFPSLSFAGVRRHEAAYVLGQLADAKALAFLEQTLEDETEHEMVRHEVKAKADITGFDRRL